ncbi:MAG: class I SAM-dependent methyltransferase family protein [Candidatus Bathyarchaeia archaeon]
MPKKVRCLRVPKKQGEEAIALASEAKIIDKEFEVQRDEDFLYIPLISQLQEDTLKTLSEKGVTYQILAFTFQERKKQKPSLAEMLSTELPPHLLASLPHAADFVGEIAIIEIPQELDAYKRIIGEAILKTNKNVRTVLAKAGAVSGTYRLREFSVIGGERKTETVHREFGCQYSVDVAKAYFSPRLSYEHKRVASLVKENETIIDMFAGVGPFAILIAKTHQNVKVYAIDANPNAFAYLKKNIRLNRAVGEVHPFFGDARHVVDEKVTSVADRVIMNLPEKAIEFVDAACRALKPEGGTIHFYSFVSAPNPLEATKLHLAEAVEKTGRKVTEVPFSRMVRETAPYEWQAVLDANIR